MAIEIRPSGEAALYAGAGAEIGKGRKREREREEAQRAEEINLRLAAEKRARQWEYEKMELRSRQDFEEELRAKAWELEKMEISSRIDFAREEQQRQKKLNDIDNALEQIDKEVQAGNITEEKAYPIRFSYQMKKFGVDTPVGLLRPPTKTYRQQLEEIVGSIGRDLSLPELEEEVKALGFDPETLAGVTPGIPTPGAPTGYEFWAEEPGSEGVAMPLDEVTARQILQEAGGNKELARQIARDRGYSF